MECQFPWHKLRDILLIVKKPKLSRCSDEHLTDMMDLFDDPKKVTNAETKTHRRLLFGVHAIFVGPWRDEGSKAAAA